MRYIAHGLNWTIEFIELSPKKSKLPLFSWYFKFGRFNEQFKLYYECTCFLEQLSLLILSRE